MNVYEVTYQHGEKTDSVLVEATGPVDAERKFRAGRPGEQIAVLCVVRQ